MKSKIYLQLLLLLIGISNILKSQTISEIPLPEMASINQYGKSDSIVVVSTAWNNLYYRFKHDSVWHQITTSPFSQITALSVDGTDIYAFASTNGNAGLSGILKSTDLGVTWTQKITEAYIQSHNIYASNFCSSNNACFWVDGYDIKRCNYTGLAITAMTSNTLLPVGQLEWINGALYFSNDNNNVSGNVFGGSCFKSTGFTSFGSGVSYFALQKPACYRNQNQVLFFDRLTGTLYASNTSGSAYNMYHTGVSSSQYNTVNLYAAYGHFYAILKTYNSTTIYHIVANPANTSVWNFAGANAVWDVYQLPFSDPDIDAIEILTDGKLLSKNGTLFLYDPNLHTFKNYSKGINEAMVYDAYINKNNDIIANINEYDYVKYATDSNFKYVSRSVLTSNSHRNKFSISNSGNVYSLDNQNLLLGRSLDSANTFTIDYFNQGIMNIFMKNDSILILKDSTFLHSNNGGNSYTATSSGNITLSISNTQPYFVSTSKNRNNILLAVQDFNLSNFTHYYTNDFGNTWNTILENQFASWDAYCIDNSNVYSINDPSMSPAYDTIYIHSANTKTPINQFTYNVTDTIYHRSFWAEDGSLYISCVKVNMGQHEFKIYKSAANNLPFTEIFSQPINGVYAATNYMMNCSSKKIITGCQNKLYLLDNTATNSNIISGQVFNDVNTDQIINANEQLTQGILTHTSSNQYSMTFSNGAFSFYDSIPNDTLKVITPMYYTSVPAYHIINVGDTAKNFALQAISNIDDLQIHVTATSAFRPGFVNGINITCKNIGTTTINNVQVKFSNANLNLLSATPAFTTFANDTLTWDILGIASQQQLTFQVIDSVISSTTIGTILTFSANALPILNDTTPLNNSYLLSATVIGSFDPNDKQVEPTTYSTSNQQNGDYLNYTIRFQNTGTASALNVVVSDTLDAMLDINTLQMIASSHNYNVQIKPNHLLEFTFANINLPDSNANEFLSHGFISFKIKPTALWSIGQNIENTAYIFFDYNLPVVTNTVSSILSSTVSLTENKVSQYGIYPNPFNNEITVSNELNSTLDILSLDGKIVFHKNVTSNLENISLKQLSSGFYFATITNVNGEKSVMKLCKR